MPTLTEEFARMKLTNEKALVLFVMAGDPTLDDLPEIIKFSFESGADVVEIGVPFSDPIADGPVIQAAGQRALDQGVTLRGVLEKIAACKDVRGPLVLMTYANPVRQFGYSKFARRCKEVGVSGCILSDLPPEAADEWIAAARQESIDTIFLVAPTSTEARMGQIASVSSGFLYAVSRTGVTGAQVPSTAEISDFITIVKKYTHIPICIGFGIHSPEQVEAIAPLADGVIVGSWYVQELHESWNKPDGRVKLSASVSALKSGTKPRN